MFCVIDGRPLTEWLEYVLQGVGALDADRLGESADQRQRSRPLP